MTQKTALITGASSGIGREFVYSLAEKGYNIVLVSRSQDTLEEIAEEIRTRFAVDAYVLAKDLSQELSPKEVYEEVKGQELTINMLVNNAGFGTTGELLQSSMEKNHQQVMVNVNSVVNLTQLFLKDMVDRGEGDIINIASMMSFLPFPYMSLYAATKAFVLSFTEGIHEEYKHKGIRVLAVCPGSTETNFFEDAPDSLKEGKMRTPKQVVETSFKALAKNRSFIVDGTPNYTIANLPRILPRKVITKISGSIMKKNMS
ncbi:SDR family oxidoreductase [Bacillus spongiae]|uniref:SDR family oxidoreductase n=1 Tax=Bacillus spongiae TaxID=2683610 RepID=A0ABU8HDN5_9BACI